MKTIEINIDDGCQLFFISDLETFKRIYETIVNQQQIESIVINDRISSSYPVWKDLLDLWERKAN